MYKIVLVEIFENLTVDELLEKLTDCRHRGNWTIVGDLRLGTLLGMVHSSNQQRASQYDKRVEKVLTEVEERRCRGVVEGSHVVLCVRTVLRTRLT